MCLNITKYEYLLTKLILLAINCGLETCSRSQPIMQVVCNNYRFREFVASYYLGSVLVVSSAKNVSETIELFGCN